MSNHDMFAAHKLLKHKYGMIMACLQCINPKYRDDINITLNRSDKV